MSALVATLVMFAMAGVWVLTAFLNHTYDHGGRDPIDPLYSISQWDPKRVEITGACVVPPAPGNCIIEGTTGAYQAATHWCQSPSGICIDPDTGKNVQNNPIEFKVACQGVPYCGWSECIITFDGVNYVQVDSQTLAGGNTAFTFTQGTIDTATRFYMERLAVKDALVIDTNGIIARFYLLPPGGGIVFTLSYTNSRVISIAGQPVQVTGLSIDKITGNSTPLLNMFILMEALPVSVASLPGDAIVSKKILVFAGANRTVNPGLEDLVLFNDHVRSSMWKAAQIYNLGVMDWVLQPPSGGGYYSLPQDTYALTLQDWTTPTSKYRLVQDVLETRLRPVTSRVFYSWLA
jgi:hypothetical protein